MFVYCILEACVCVCIQGHAGVRVALFVCVLGWAPFINSREEEALTAAGKTVLFVSV